MVLGLKRKEVVLLPHDQAWEVEAKKAISILKDIFGDSAKGIEHVGSTSIKELKAKPIIDLAIGVSSFKDVDPLYEKLDAVGFKHIEEDDDENQRFLSFAKDGLVFYHVHIVIYEDREWNGYIFFRDYLSIHEKERKEYEALKTHLMEIYPHSRDEYTSHKNEFISKILKRNPERK